MRTPLWVEVDLANQIAFIRGRAAKQAILDAGEYRAEWLPSRRRWTMRAKFVSDLVAMAEHDGRRVHLSEVGGEA